jgi:hypothetical protein
MKKLIAALMLFGWGCAQAATITIDFEEQSILSGGGGAFPFDGPDFGVSQDFEFFRADGQAEGGWTPGDLGGAATGNASDIALDWSSVAGDGTLTMEYDGGSSFTFTLHSLDFLAGSLSASVGTIEVTGYYAGGGSLATTLTASSAGFVWDSAVFDASWNGLRRVEFDASDLDSLAALDNLVVTAVPVPAAVWLFGSGLAALGWSRRRQTA